MTVPLRRTVATIGFLLLASVPAVHAARQYDTLTKDLDAFGGVLDQEYHEEAIENGEAVHDVVTDLFVDTTGSGSTRDEVQADPFVTFRENGIPYTLKDVPRQEWFAPYVRDIVERHIVSGYRDVNGTPTGEFGPANNVAVDELSKIAVMAAGVNTELCTGASKNPMIASGGWARPYVLCAERLGWALYSDGTVDLRRPATRAEVVMTLVQAFDVPLKQISGTGVIFSDVGSSTQFAPAIHTAALDGVVSGYGDTGDANTKPLFGPGNPINRAEVAKMLSVALQIYYR